MARKSQTGRMLCHYWEPKSTLVCQAGNFPPSPFCSLSSLSNEDTSCSAIKRILYVARKDRSDLLPSFIKRSAIGSRVDAAVVQAFVALKAQRQVPEKRGESSVKWSRVNLDSRCSFLMMYLGIIVLSSMNQWLTDWLIDWLIEWPYFRNNHVEQNG